MRAATEPADVPMVECPRCPARSTAATIEAHLVEQHLVSPSVAKAMVSGGYLYCCDRMGPAHAAGCRIEHRPKIMPGGPPARPTPPQPPPVAPAPKEPVMADLSTRVPCKACSTPFVRKHARDAYCPTCAKTPKCGGCKWRGGVHSPTCHRKAVKKPAGRKTATGGGKAPKPRPAKAVSRNGAGKLDAMLTEAKASVTTLREELARAEVRVQVLMELAGA